MSGDSAVAGQKIFEVNPYESHPSLTPIESEVLWEYAKLSQHIKDVRLTSLNA
jgi:DASH complex subunit DAD3